MTKARNSESAAETFKEAARSVVATVAMEADANRRFMAFSSAVWLFECEKHGGPTSCPRKGYATLSDRGPTENQETR
jgi:hypothetical protein